jgi:GTP pyrophosphokinase
MNQERLEEAGQKFNFVGPEDMMVAIGYGGITAAQIVTKLTEKYKKEQKETQAAPFVPDLKPAANKRLPHGVRVKGVDNLLVRFSRCCNPVPGDEVIGFITRGRGVSIHRKDCPNVQEGVVEEERLIPVEWEAGPENAYYYVDIEVTGFDRHGLLNEVLQAVSEMKTSIHAINGRSDKQKLAIVDMTISIHNLEHLHKIVERLKRIKDVYSVCRVTQ